ncbi:MAG: pentapeptide repeat-containing protein [Pygmaiobacter massiliensis]|uniref:pentapeptide repeat-containing protein n=1 Tax=Pygmaiobacter massiliensis TaxID=1917873 RepID=UPI0035E3DC06
MLFLSLQLSSFGRRSSSLRRSSLGGSSLRRSSLRGSSLRGSSLGRSSLGRSNFRRSSGRSSYGRRSRSLFFAASNEGQCQNEHQSNSNDLFHKKRTSKFLFYYLAASKANQKERLLL